MIRWLKKLKLHRLLIKAHMSRRPAIENIEERLQEYELRANRLAQKAEVVRRGR